MNRSKNKKFPFFIVILVVLLLIFLRFGISFYKSGGFSGLSILLPVLLLCFILFALCASAFFAAWVYQDCKLRGEDPVLWVAVVFIATPIIGLLIYFLRRSEIKRDCPGCGHRISLRAKYCEECGARMENREDYSMMMKQKTHHLQWIVAGIISMAFMLLCLTGFIAKAVTGNGVNTDVTSNDRIWNLGMINMNFTSYNNGVWHLDFRSASDGFIEEQDMTVQDADTQILHADISCAAAPDGASLVLWLVQGDLVQSIDVTDLSEPLKYPLKEFKNGKIHVRLQINGVEDTVSEICIK